ncbi:ABC transporter ATP-binding protein [soil metagenome]
MIILSVQDLSKTYGNIKALDHVTFSVPEGVVFGILGPNGSGKTTLLGTVMDVIRATSGTYKLFEEVPEGRHRQMIGTLLETPNFYHYLSAQKNLEISAAIKGRGKDDIDRVLQLVNLTERRHSKFSAFSLGMKQRLAIGACLLGDPSVLIFDEPTNGLDPAGIAEIRELIKKLNQQGKTIIMASHLLDEVEKVCTHVAILKKGVLLASGNVDDIFATEDIVEVAADNLDVLAETLQQMNGYSTLKIDNKLIQLFYGQGKTDIAGINRFCFEKGITLTHLQFKKKSLESKFIELTNTKS